MSQAIRVWHIYLHWPLISPTAMYKVYKSVPWIVLASLSESFWVSERNYKRHLNGFARWEAILRNILTTTMIVSNRFYQSSFAWEKCCIVLLNHLFALVGTFCPLQTVLAYRHANGPSSSDRSVGLGCLAQWPKEIHSQNKHIVWLVFKGSSWCRTKTMGYLLSIK